MIRIANKKGSVALTTVIVVTAILLISGVSLALTSGDLAKATKNFTNRFIAKAYSQSCLEESLLKIKSGYTGTFTMTVDLGSCSSTVAINGSNSNYRDLTLQGVQGSNNFKETRTYDISQTPYLLITIN